MDGALFYQGTGAIPNCAAARCAASLRCRCLLPQPPSSRAAGRAGGALCALGSCFRQLLGWVLVRTPRAWLFTARRASRLETLQLPCVCLGLFIFSKWLCNAAPLQGTLRGTQYVLHALKATGMPVWGHPGVPAPHPGPPSPWIKDPDRIQGRGLCVLA